MAYEKEQARLEKLMQEVLSEDEDSLFGDIYLSDYQLESGSESSGSSTLSFTPKRRKKNIVPQKSLCGKCYFTFSIWNNPNNNKFQQF